MSAPIHLSKLGTWTKCGRYVPLASLTNDPDLVTCRRCRPPRPLREVLVDHIAAAWQRGGDDAARALEAVLAEWEGA